MSVVSSPKQTSRIEWKTVTHHGDASHDFIVDLILTGNDYPNIRVLDETGYPKPKKFANVKLTVCSVTKEKRSFGRTNRPISVLVFVLCDGSSTYFKACTNSGLTSF